jgi:hypothetical protein
MSKFFKRGIHNKKFLYEIENGSLKPLVELVNSNEDLVLQIRDDYFNVYYQGGNVAKVTSSKSVDFDENYFRTHIEKSKENWEEIKKKRQTTMALFKKGLFSDYIDTVKSAMKYYWDNVLEGKGVAEKMAQHQICILNTNQTEYTVIDLEYQVSTESIFKYRGKRKTKSGGLPSPRFDIVAIRNSDHRLCVIELKKGTKALKDPSGVQEHAESFVHTIGFDKKTKNAFLSEMNDVLQMKKKLKLIDEIVFIDTTLEPEFLYAYQNNPNEQDYKKGIILDFEMQKRYFRYYQEYKKKDNFAKCKKVIWLDENCYLLKD